MAAGAGQLRVVHEQSQLVAQPQTFHRRRRSLRIGLQPPLDLDPVGHVELPINEGLEFGVAHRLDHHCAHHPQRGPLAGCRITVPDRAAQGLARRASRDISVPMGRFKISAASR